MSDADVVVVGAGAAGLAAAHGLRAVGRSVRVLEAAPQPGGVMQTGREGGFVFERGPNTFRVGPDALALFQQLGLEAALRKADPVGRERYLFHEGRLVPVPMGPGAFLRTPLLSAAGKLRILREPFVARGDASGESVAAFVSRRLGPEVLERLVGPFLVGVYAGDEHRLGAEAVFPSLVRMERESGSIAGGAARSALRGGPRGLAGSFSGPEGLGSLAALLARPLGEALVTGTAVRAVARDGDAWRVETEAGALRAAVVVLATPAAAAAELLAPVDAEVAAFCRGVAYAPAVSVALDLAPGSTTHPLRGFGYLIPRDAGLDLLGVLFMSQLFPGRAPVGRELATAMIGGTRWSGIVDASDEDVVARVREGLDRTLGLRAEPRVIAISRWRRGIPQPGVGHPAAVRAAEARLAREHPGLALVGSYLHGISLGDTLACGYTLPSRRWGRS